MAETPDRPAKAFSQNVSTPIPIGETRPSPVTTTRFFTGAPARLDASSTYYAKPLAASNARDSARPAPASARPAPAAERRCRRQEDPVRASSASARASQSDMP